MNVELLNFELMTLEEATELKLALGKLLESSGWRFVLQFLEARHKGRRDELYSTTPDSVEAMVRFAKIKGGLEELQLIPVMIQQMHTDVSEEIRRLQDVEEELQGELDLEEMGAD